MNNTTHASLYSSTNSSTSTLRPRAGRLISYLDDGGSAESTAVTTSTLAPPPRFPDRGLSPNEATITRSKSDKVRNGQPGRTHTRSSSGSQQSLSTTWGSLQGFASTFLGNETPATTKDKSAGSFKTPLWMRQDKQYATKPSTKKWGPSTGSSTTPAHDLIEQRQALVQAKKREALLLASAQESRDSLGRFKRRDSDADTAFNSADPDQTEDALVYMHKVEKGDTLAGVIIKYNCPADPFRKINRFWPNDNIQTRSHVLVPLEGPTIKGRKVDSPYLSKDLFDPGLDHLTIQDTPSPGTTSQTLSNGIHKPSQATSNLSSSTLTPGPLSLITTLADTADLRHDSWVHIPNFKDPTEILRVSRRALGYFPRARRKSNATLTVASSTASTPKTSFDLLRHPPTHAAQQAASLDASPVRRPALQNSRLSSIGRQRSSSTSNPNNPSFADVLRGPGGVGDLRGLRTLPSRPGPADDPLNKKFNEYFPDFLPLPPPPGDLPRTGFSALRLGGGGTRSTPRASTDSARSTRSNSSTLATEMGTGLEGWVKRMAGTTARKDVDRLGDLIELETTPLPLDNNVDPFDRSRDGGGDEDVTPTATTSDFATQEALLNERFPVRGRIRTAYSREAGKTD